MQVSAILLLAGIPVMNLIGIHAIMGNFSSMRIMGFSITMPLEALEVIAASSTFDFPLFFSTLIPIILTILLGAVFCSWICPQNTVSELGDIVHCKLYKKKAPDPTKRVFFIIPFFLIFLVLIVDTIFQMTIFTLLHPAAIVARTCVSFVFLGIISLQLFFIVIILCVEILGIRRVWCRYVCPLGALLSLLGLKRILKIKFNQTLCNHCLSCLSTCPFGNDPRKEPLRCRNCGICISTCNKGALYYR
ncbi:MAG: 4Fe-4S binding protein [Desulfobacterales bacterium]|nr:4Fe-4S binding protein [Desulfobacterales bacterium]